MVRATRERMVAFCIMLIQNTPSIKIDEISHSYVPIVTLFRKYVVDDSGTQHKSFIFELKSTVV